MRRTRTRSTIAPRIEALEVRSMLSADVNPIARLADFTALTIDDRSFNPSQVLVRFKEGTGARAEALGAGPELGVVPGLRAVGVPAGQDVTQMLAALGSNPDVLYAEPDYTVRVTATPNDPKYGSQWALNNTGQTGGVIDADIDAPEAWDTPAGAETLVAVIDTGIDYNHPDLAANIWTNPGEIAGNGIDDDGNGYADDIHGYDFANNDADPMDDNGHGTHVSGTIGAVTNNGLGVAGIASNVKLMALKFLSASGSGALSGAISALNYAVANGASISNNSWGGGGFSQVMFDAIRAAAAKGHIFVAAAGNNGSNNDAKASYPSNYDSDNVIAVAATDASDKLASFSNYGATQVDIAAPGVSILSTKPGSLYGTMSGTSMASPHVTGVVAMVRGQHPDWTYRQVIDRVLGAADPVPGLAGKVVTGGRLNALKAVDPPVDLTGPRVTASTPSGTTTGPVSVVRVTFSEAIDPTTLTLSDAALTGPTGPIALTAITPVAGSGNLQFDLGFASQTTDGTYSLTLGPDVLDASGNAMDQNANGINGEPADAFATSFTISAPSQAPIGSDEVYDAYPAPFENLDLVPGAPGVVTLIGSTKNDYMGVNLTADAFNFYGTTFTTLYVSSNGLISFGSPNTSAANTKLTTSPTQAAIAPLWDSWNSSAGQPSTLARLDDLDGNGTADRLVIEWNQVVRKSPSTTTFQAILELNTGAKPGSITFNYPDLDTGNWLSNGASATVGQKDAGSQGTRRLLLSLNDGKNPYVQSGTAIQIVPKAGSVTSAGVEGLGTPAPAPPSARFSGWGTAPTGAATGTGTAAPWSPEVYRPTFDFFPSSSSARRLQNGRAFA